MYVGLNVRFRKCILFILFGLFILWYLNSLRKHQTEDLNQTISLKSLLASAIRASELGGLQVVAVHDNVDLVIQSKGKTKEGKDIFSKRLCFDDQLIETITCRLTNCQRLFMKINSCILYLD